MARSGKTRPALLDARARGGSTKVNPLQPLEIEEDRHKRLEDPNWDFGLKASRPGEPGYRPIETLSAWHEAYGGQGAPPALVTLGDHAWTVLKRGAAWTRDFW